MPQPNLRDLRRLRREHTPEAIRRRLAAAAKHSYIRDFVYGAIDGAVTTFAVVSGVAGADLSSGIVVVLGLANLVGDGFSMAASNFLGTRAEDQLRERARRIEQEHIDAYPEGETEEVRQLIRGKGFEGEDLERAVEIVTSDREQWVEMMLAEEHGLPPSSASPLRAATTTFLAFVIVGLLPLGAFLATFVLSVDIRHPFVWSVVCTSLAFLAVGAIKSRFVDQPWYWSALETLFVGGTAAGLAYVVGVALRDVGT
jgi:VIT1/CCC1 family predicted Fe2+/Mn2+ transporter